MGSELLQRGHTLHQFKPSRSNITDASRLSLEASPPRYRYIQPCHVHPELICQRYVIQKQPGHPSSSTNVGSQISSSASQPRLQSSPHTTRNLQSHPEKSRPPSDSSCRVSLQSTPSQRVQRQSPSTPARANRRCHDGGFLVSSCSTSQGFGL